MTEEAYPPASKQRPGEKATDSIAAGSFSKHVPDPVAVPKSPLPQTSPGADAKASPALSAGLDTLSTCSAPDLPGTPSPAPGPAKERGGLANRSRLPWSKPELGRIAGPKGFPGPAPAKPQGKPSAGKRDRSYLAVQVYAQDPSITRNGRPILCTYDFPRTLRLGNGPTSPRITVVDYDHTTRRLVPAAEWNEKKGCFGFRGGRRGGWVPLTEEHLDRPQYHQLNVWAVIQHILEFYEATWVLGRAAPWAFEGNRLIVVPHAGHLDNAFYDRRSKSIQFYYCDGHSGQVNTCLSHDIIAHETGHAILDGIRPFYSEDSSIQTTAFHEFVADLTAIMTALLNRTLREVIAEDSWGDLAQARFLSGLAEEFSQSTGDRPELRNALNRITMQDVSQSRSPHEWSQVMTGALFDILVKMAAAYLPQGIGKQALASGQSDPEQEARNVELSRIENALNEAAVRFRRVALQPLDYLPPVDVQFRDYCCAMLRADEVADPVDEKQFRPMIREVFRARGIEFSPEKPAFRANFNPCNVDRLTLSPTDAYLFLNENRRYLRIPDAEDVSVAGLYQTDKTDVAGNKLAREVVLQYIWREDVELDGTGYGDLQGKKVALLCGGTLVFDGRGNLLHWARKPGTRPLSGTEDRGDDWGQGQMRRSELKEYIKDRIALGRLDPASLERASRR